MVLYRDLGDRPFPDELWAFLADLFGEGPLMVRFGRFGSASFCIVVRRDLFRQLPTAVISLWAPVVSDFLAVRICKFKINVHVRFNYWFIWRNYDSMDAWISANRLGYRAVNWPVQDRLRTRIVKVFQRACRLYVLEQNCYVGYVGSY